MGEYAGIHPLEHTGPDQKRLARQQFFRNARPNHQSPGDAIFFHDLLGGDGRRDHDGQAAIMPLPMPRRALHHRLLPGDARILRETEQRVDVAAERDRRPLRSPCRRKGGRNPGDATRDRKAVLLKNIGEIGGRPDLLKTRLREAEQLVDHDLDLLGLGIHMGDGLRFQLRQVRPCLDGWRDRPVTRQSRRDGDIAG